eukprot:CAMPEP_0177611170 /NCGR_PEP_ID=MMETSP0419_2-20121207/20316_1 /TAXON_ID=582737 /ORGANISM="Tetraselmis sp., Strain GSL018" /LENGTH=69 /DNA_ID=CAMNT_0019106817 /DNA_START=95 /DNA_END=300 /DNA_ORIENTATION=+
MASNETKTSEEVCTVQKPDPVSRTGRRRIAVIGGGLSGICTARQLLIDGIEPVIFEVRNKLGGLWLYDP